MLVASSGFSSPARIRPGGRAFFGLCLRYRRQFSSKTLVKENDIILLKKKGDDTATPILTKPLRPSGKIQTPRGSIDQASLIGKGIRDVVSTNAKVEYRIHQPTLAEYVTLCPRIVTPVYPADANLIVSLLDLHPSKESDDQSTKRPLEIFEAGTGHGALTLHLSRAIHGANPAAPPVPTIQAPKDMLQGREEDGTRDKPHHEDAIANGEPLSQKEKDEHTAWEAYLPTRRAVIQTLDISGIHSRHARSVVRNFRDGIYFHNVDFHVGTIPEYLSSRLAFSPEPFLAHTILDLPNPHSHFDIVAQALQPNGSLIVFVPSITQIGKCVQLVRGKKLPFVLETVLELGAGIGVGGREWDVRAVKPRALLKAEAQARKTKEVNGEPAIAASSPHAGDDLSETDGKDGGREMICRPKVGGRISGGGFLGLWRRMEHFHRELALPVDPSLGASPELRESASTTAI